MTDAGAVQAVSTRTEGGEWDGWMVKQRSVRSNLGRFLVEDENDGGGRDGRRRS